MTPEQLKEIQGMHTGVNKFPILYHGDLEKYFKVAHHHRGLLLAEVERLRHEIDCACNALQDSIMASGNDGVTNMAWVKKLRRVIHGEYP